MKHSLAAVACLVGLLTAASISSARDTVPVLTQEQLRWEQYGPTAGLGNGTKVDTTFFSGATQTVDTTEAFQGTKLAYAGPGLSPIGTAFGLFRIGVSHGSGNVSPNVDSLFVAIDTAPSKGGPWNTGTFVGGLGCASGDYWCSIKVTADSDDNSALAWISQTYAAVWMRFRIRVDGNTAAAMSGTRAYIAYFKSEGQ